MNDSRDPGGETQWGISKRQYPDLDIKRLSKAKAKEIYKMDYWEKMKCEELPAYIRLLVFDSAVNQGALAAAIMLQRAIGVDQDGLIGTVTIKTAHTKNPQRLKRDYAAERALRYAKSKNFNVFGKGWMRRLMEVVAL